MPNHFVELLDVGLVAVRDRVLHQTTVAVDEAVIDAPSVDSERRLLEALFRILHGSTAKTQQEVCLPAPL